MKAPEATVSTIELTPQQQLMGFLNNLASKFTPNQTDMIDIRTKAGQPAGDVSKNEAALENIQAELVRAFQMRGTLTPAGKVRARSAQYILVTECGMSMHKLADRMIDELW